MTRSCGSDTAAVIRVCARPQNRTQFLEDSDAQIACKAPWLHDKPKDVHVFNFLPQRLGMASGAAAAGNGHQYDGLRDPVNDPA